MSNDNIDQMAAGIRDGLPRLWYALYVGCVQAGFEKSQAFALLQTFILSNGNRPAIPPTCDGPEPPAA